MQTKKLHFLCFLVLLSSTILAGCGGPPPNSFLKSTTDELDYISWNNDNNQLSGNIVQVKASSYAPTVGNIPITGTLDNNHVTITTGSTIYFTGYIDNNRQLQISSTDATGHSIQTAWYNISHDDYNTLVTAFNSYTKLGNLVKLLLRYDVIALPQDSSSSSAEVQAQSDSYTINSNNDLIQSMKEHSGNCDLFLFGGGLSQVSDNFQLTDDAKNPTFATLDSDFKSVQQQWNSTKKVTIPQVDVPMPWRITQKQIDDLSAEIKTVKQSVATQITADQKQLDQLNNQYADQVNQYNQTYRQYCQKQ